MDERQGQAFCRFSNKKSCKGNVNEKNSYSSPSTHCPVHNFFNQLSVPNSRKARAVRPAKRVYNQVERASFLDYSDLQSRPAHISSYLCISWCPQCNDVIKRQIRLTLFQEMLLAITFDGKSILQRTMKQMTNSRI